MKAAQPNSDLGGRASRAGAPEHRLSTPWIVGVPGGRLGGGRRPLGRGGAQRSQAGHHPARAPAHAQLPPSHQHSRRALNTEPFGSRGARSACLSLPEIQPWSTPVGASRRRHPRRARWAACDERVACLITTTLGSGKYEEARGRARVYCLGARSTASLRVRLPPSGGFLRTPALP